VKYVIAAPAEKSTPMVESTEPSAVETKTPTEEPASQQAVSAQESVVKAAQALQGEISDDAVRLVSPNADAYAYGVLPLKAEVDLPAEAVLRVDFLVDGRQVASVAAPPYEAEHDFGRGFDARVVEAVAILRDGREIRDRITTVPLENSDYYINTRLVTLDATVIDWRDRLVGDLKQDEFRVWEDGVEQEVTHFTVEERPIRVALLLDASGSMQYGNKMAMAVESAKQFLDYLKPEQDKAALIVFTDLVNKLSGFTNDFSRLKAMLDKVQAEGGTAINDTLDAVAPMFEEETGRKAIVLITDGLDEHSSTLIDDAIEKVRRAGVKVYSIGIFDNDYFNREMQEAIQPPSTTVTKAPDVDPTDARKKRRTFERGSDVRKIVFEGMADATGGAVFFPEKLSQLPVVFHRIADELRNMYALGYIPTNKTRDGKWRDIKVETTRGGLTVRTRRGYYAEK
jgi:Ca-activated chloride channel homolog